MLFFSFVLNESCTNRYLAMNMNTHKGGDQVRRRIIIETFVVFLIVISPFIFKLHEYFSSDPEATVNFFGYIIDRNGFANLSIYAWFLLGKIVPLSLLVLWFFTCKHWWYHAILIPITMYAFQIFEGVFSEDRYVDTENLLWLLPVCMVIIPFVYVIRLKLYDKYVHGIDLNAMEKELNVVKTKKLKDKEIRELRAELPKIEYRTLSEWLNQELSTANLERIFRRFQTGLKDLLAYLF